MSVAPALLAIYPACGDEGEPPVPPWLAISMALFGFFGIGTGILRSTLAFKTQPFRVSLLLIGMACRTGVSLCRIVVRKPKTLRQGRPSGCQL